MTEQAKNIVRDFFHLFIGFTFVYIIGSFTDFSTYTLEGKIIGCTSLSFFLGGFLGLAWELYQFKKKKIKKIGFKDVLITAFGGLMGGLFSLWFPDLLFLGIALTVISVLLVVRELKKNKY